MIVKRNTTQQTAGEELLRTVIENPADASARRAYARWLRRNGDPDRAEIIRLQLTPGWRHDDARDSRVWELLDQHQGRWAPFAGEPGVHYVSFSKGFPEEVAATAVAFLRRGHAWAAITPLAELTLTDLAGLASRVARCPHLASVTSLLIGDGEFDDDDLADLVGSPYLPNLTSLYLNPSWWAEAPSPVTDRGLAALAASPVFPRLTSITINSDGTIGADGLAALAAVQESRLERLWLWGTGIDDRGAAALASAGGLHALTELNLLGGEVGNEGLIALLRSPHLAGLTSACVTHQRVTGEVLRTLAEGPFAPNLRTLNLDANPLGDVDAGAVVALLRSRPDLTLNLTNCSIPSGTLAKLGKRFPRRVRFEPVESQPNRDEQLM